MDNIKKRAETLTEYAQQNPMIVISFIATFIVGSMFFGLSVVGQIFIVAFVMYAGVNYIAKD